ncbi:aldehyde dehydrogenase family protein [Sorangium sp. So ce296]|uniref:aldehyde dehydrogenase family protein n=1 Tax=Sorangium sp. So ce296 TaxID=3133296 RepID=UPI003F6091F9
MGSIVEEGWIHGTSPLDGAPLSSVRVTAAGDIAGVVHAARRAQAAWARRPVAERARALAEAGRRLLGRADEIAQALHRELGKPMADAYGVDLGSTPEVFRYYTTRGEAFLGDEAVAFNPVMFPRKRARVERLPHGVVGLITPWNYPVSVAMHNLVPALLAGNAVVLKPSEHAARTGAALAGALREALPEALLGLVQGGAEAGAALVAEVDHVVFVGGAAVGRAVARAAADRLIPAQIELGGKDAAIVLRDADLERAAHGVAWAGFVNAGQSCAGIERVYVEAEVFEAFVERLVAVAERLRAGDDGGAPGTVEIGPLVTEAQMARVEAHVRAAVAAGARVRCGGARRGNFYLPTVLTGVDPSLDLLREETFGPVLPVIAVPDAGAAVRAANESVYGLTGSVWTRDVARGEALARELRVGVATVNNHMFTGAAPQAVWTGRGRSGYGVQNGPEALRAMTRPRLIAVDESTASRELWWFPYDRAFVEMSRGMVRSLGASSGLDRLSSVGRMVRGAARRWIGARAASRARHAWGRE